MQHDNPAIGGQYQELASNFSATSSLLDADTHWVDPTTLLTKNFQNCKEFPERQVNPASIKGAVNAAFESGPLKLLHL
ncbi:MAG: hypothetical protein Fur0046_34030 [Cyanobacteria bacterium J069]